MRDLGSGPPVVLLHPGPGLDGSVFLPGAQALVGAGFRALLVDLPGTGRSPAGDWTFARQAEAVEDFAPEIAAAFEREASVSTPDECLDVWRDQLPWFAEDRYWPALVDWLRRTTP